MFNSIDSQLHHCLVKDVFDLQICQRFFFILNEENMYK